MLQIIKFCAERQHFARKIFKIDTKQPLVAPVRHQKLHFLNKNSEAKHFSKIVSFKKIKNTVQLIFSLKTTQEQTDVL